MTQLELKRGILLGVALGLLGSLVFSCAHTSESKLDASRDTHSTVDATKHETETRDEQPTKIVTVTTRPDGTRREKTIYKGAVAVKRELEADAKSLLGDEQHVQTEAQSTSKPFGIFAFLAAFWPYIAAALPVLTFLFRKQIAAFALKVGFKIPFL